MPWEIAAYEFDEKRDLERCPAWFSDEMHYTPPRRPFAVMTHQETQTHTLTWAYEHASLPRIKGMDWRQKHGVGYIGPIGVTDEAEIRQREAKFREVLAPIIEDYPKVWAQYKAELEGYWQRIDAVDITKLITVDLMGHMMELLRLDFRQQELHYFLMFVLYGPYTLFEELTKEMFGFDDTHPTFHKLMAGFDNRTFQSDRQLWQLARRAFELKLDGIFLRAKAEEVSPALEESDAGGKWLAELREYLKVFGKRMRALHAVDYPTWEEDISIPILRVQGFMRKGGAFKLDEERQRAVKERGEAEKEILAKISPEQREWFEMLLRCAQNSSSYSEEHEWWMNDPSDAYMRYCAQEIGRRFVQANTFDDPDEVFYLTIREVLQYGYHPQQVNLRSLIDSRKALFEQWKKARPVPLLILKPGVTPEEAMGLLMAMADPTLSKVVIGRLPTVRPELKADLWGTGGSAGVVEGTARVIMSDDQFGEIKPGDILVAPVTFVTWTAIFSLLSGVVTEMGGSLAHAAICAREHGIPAVVGAMGATQKIKSGQRIKVDANVGAVYILQ